MGGKSKSNSEGAAVQQDGVMPSLKIEAGDASGVDKSSASASATEEQNKPDVDMAVGADVGSEGPAGLQVQGDVEADATAARARGKGRDGVGGGHGNLGDADGDAGGATGLTTHDHDEEGRGGREGEGELEQGREGGAISIGGTRGTTRRENPKEPKANEAERDPHDEAEGAAGSPVGAATITSPPGTDGGGGSAATARPQIAQQEEEEEVDQEEETAAVRAAAREKERPAAAEGGGGGHCHSRSHSHSRTEVQDRDRGRNPSALPARGGGGNGGGEGAVDGAEVTGVVGWGQQNGATVGGDVVGSGVDSKGGVAVSTAKSEEGVAEAVPGQQNPPVAPAKASRTLADAAAFVEAEGIAADAAYTDALNAAQAQEAHLAQPQGHAAVSEAERALAALAAAALQPSPGSAAATAAAAGVGGGGGAANAPAAPAGVTFSLADRDKDKEKQLYQGDCSASEIPPGWRQLQAPHMVFIQCQLAVLTGLVMLILICWRRHGRMISVLYAPPADVATQCQVPSTP
eukprot:g15513.t1